MIVKLLASDFDKTLFCPTNYKKNIKYINKFVDHGNIFVIVTGRYIEALLKDIKDTGLKYSFIICNDGGIIFDKDLNIIYQKDVPKNIVNDITTLYENSNCLDDWYIDTGTSITKDKNSTANGLIGKFNNKDEAYKLLALIKENFSGIGGYISETWINITEKSVNKGTGVKILADHLNIHEKDIYTIGDNINDIPMSDYGFNSFCMTDSVLELKSKTIRAYNSVYELVIDILKNGLK